MRFAECLHLFLLLCSSLIFLSELGKRLNAIMLLDVYLSNKRGFQLALSYFCSLTLTCEYDGKNSFSLQFAGAKNVKYHEKLIYSVTPSNLTPLTFFMEDR